VYASHIVGGEFELLHLQGNQYRLNLIYYFDVNNNNFNGVAPEVSEPSLTAYIYRKSDDHLMTTAKLLFDTKARVGYTQPSCSKGEIVTDKLTYTTVIELDPTIYNDAAGYYVAWERCCRNYNLINNIYSEDPTGAGDKKAAGQTFYLEFPPVVKDGKPFINSSPRSFPALNDYACIGRPYYVDFTGVDDDGDSLVYSLTTPLSTHTFQALPPVLPQPYPLIEWKPGYSLETITKGNPDLRITKRGLLTVTPPALEGLYVFAVKVEQFRNKQKIGESRRDFQMFVIDCQVAYPPKIVGKKLTETTFTYDHDNPMSVNFPNTTANDDRCIQVQVSDPDSENPLANYTENIKIRVIGLNFTDPDLNQILPAEVSATLTHGSTKDFRICFPQCPFTKGPYQIGIIAMDDACSLPLLDTLKITVNVEPPPNADPYFVTPSAPVFSEIPEGTQGIWAFEVRDDDLDSLTLSVATDGFVLAEAGMKIHIISQEKGLIKGQLEWDAFCDIYNFAKRTSFNILLAVNDVDLCDVNDPVTVKFNLTVKLPDNEPPEVYTDLADHSVEVISGLERKINETLSFNVTGADLTDNDLVSLTLFTNDFNAEDYNIRFTAGTARGIIQSPFQWNLRCNKFDLTKKDQFDLFFVAVDSVNKCHVVLTDTVQVQLKVLPADNEAPVLTITNKNPEVLFANNQVEAVLGKQILLSVDGVDDDVFPKKDSLTLELQKVEGDNEPKGYLFPKAFGFGTVNSMFTWNPDCSIFVNDIYENNYSFTFYLKDNKCSNPRMDSAVVKIRIKDVEVIPTEFHPPNVFTPNDDDVNDYYAMEMRDENTGELKNILPPDNCVGQFERIRIFNRWGNMVYESSDRNFRWYGKDAAAGVYYYQVQYSNRTYKGAVSVRN
jgi:hypothetical protein